MNSKTFKSLRSIAAFKIAKLLRLSQFLVAIGFGTSGSLAAQQMSALPQLGATTSLIQISEGTFYGTANTSYINGASGLIFKMTSDGTITTLYSFLPSYYDPSLTPNGTGPTSPLVAASDGNFYGMTSGGGANGRGVIYKMTPSGTTTPLYTFGTTAQDGSGSGEIGSVGLIQGPDGALYGLSGQGGVGVSGSSGNGTIFKITLGGQYQILHWFQDGTLPGDGLSPVGTLALGLDGSFYGVTYFGGSGYDSAHGHYGYGVAYKVTSAGVVTLLHSFGDNSAANDGINPITPLVRDAGGNFYGITATGGSAGMGAIYKMTSAGVVTILHSFGDNTVPADGYIDANTPNASLMIGSDGNLYGTTYYGGFYDYGAIFRITPQGAMTTLYSFNNPSASVGYYPATGLFQGADGNFYGGTYWGLTYTSGFQSTNTGTLYKFSLAPIFASSNSATFQVGSTNTFAVHAAGTPAPNYSAVGLPTWASLNSVTGVLSGTPPGTAAAPYSISLSANNGFGSPVTQAFTLNVQASSATPSIADGPPPATAIFGTAYDFTFQAIGTPPPVYSVSTGTLPPGLSLTTGGNLSGMPTQNGVFTGTIQASNGVNPPATKTFTITVEQPAFISNGPPPTATYGVPYSFTYQASGYPAPTNYTMTSLPSGLSISSAGVLSGTPTQTGTFSGETFVYNGVGSSSYQVYTLVVQQAVAITSGIPNAQIAQGTFYTFTLGATGYPSPTFTVTAGSIPSGMTLSSSGVFSGVPTQSGTFTGTITASNGIGTPATQNFIFTVLPSSLQHYTILHSFSDGSVPKDGSDPGAPMIRGMDGNFYGTTTTPYSGGTVFKMTPQGVVTVLHVFGDGSTSNDGNYPSNLVQGLDGNFYGVTNMGGAYGVGNGSLGYGTVFKVTPQGVCTILHNFGAGGNSSPDGIAPLLLIRGWDGNFYGVTSPGTFNSSKIFQITPSGQFTTLINLANSANSLVQAFDGNFYGTTGGGGIGTNSAEGTFFKMTPQGTMTVLHNFRDGSVANDGNRPSGSSLIQGMDGNFYGVTQYGGATQNGAIYKVTPQGVVTILHSFADGSINNDGQQPAGLFQATDGNLYGTTSAGGYPFSAGGVAYQITPAGAYTLLHAFGDGSTAKDGFIGGQSFVEGLNGQLYGVTYLGGSVNSGTIFSMNLGLSAPLPPAVTSGNSVVFTAGQSNNFSVKATGTPTPLFIANGLPSWASLNLSTGVLSGTPPDGASSPFSILLNAYDGFGSTSTQSFTLNVLAPPLIDSLPPPSGGVGLSYSFPYHASSYPASTFTVSVGSLPPGLTLSSAGLLSGIPTQSATFTGTVKADNGNSPFSTQNFSITIHVPKAPVLTNSAPATVGMGSSYFFQYQLDSATYPTATFSVTSGALPTGLSITSTGLISGTASQVGAYTAIIVVTNGINPDLTQNLTIAVQKAPSIISSPNTNPIALTIGQSYTYNYVASGFPPPTFSVGSGTLPQGMTLTAAGVLSGAPTQAGAYTGIILASNGVVPNAGQSFTINVSSGSFNNWTNSYSTAFGINIGGPSASYEKDGISNLLKYLFNLNPIAPMSAADWNALPVVALTNIGGTQYLTLTYRRNSSANGITVNVQTSSDLQTWTTANPPDLSQQVGIDSTTGDPIMEVGVKTNGAPKLFIRLSVTSP